MEWNNGEQNIKKGMSTSSKVLLGIIIFMLLIIVMLTILLMNTKETSFDIYIDGKITTSVDKTSLLTTINDKRYVDIQQFSEIVGYEYHKGEYKSAIIENDKCYVEADKETASFYLNENKVYKLPINKQSEQYEEYIISNPIQEKNGVMYATTEAISKAFNVLISETIDEFKIYTLDYLISVYNTEVIDWGYTAIEEQSFENQKALLYDCLIVKKEGGLYKIIDTNNTKEIVLDRYTAIEFYENTQQFFVTDSSNKVGIVNLDGTIQIEPMYDSISLLSKEYGLYIVEQDKKYGVISSKGKSIIYPEYDNIGLTNNSTVDNKYLLLNELIPVCKDKKWGAFNVDGKLILNTEYDEFGYNLNSIEVNGVKEVVQPIVVIESVNGIIVKRDSKYGLFDVKGKELVQIIVDGIYAAHGIEDEKEKYFMLYNGEKLNVIQRLITVGAPQEDLAEDINDEKLDNITENVTIGNNIVNNINNLVETQNVANN